MMASGLCSQRAAAQGSKQAAAYLRTWRTCAPKARVVRVCAKIGNAELLEVAKKAAEAGATVRVVQLLQF